MGSGERERRTRTKKGKERGQKKGTDNVAPHSRLGLSPPDSVPNLTRRIDARLRSHPQLADELQQIMDGIVPGTKNKV